MNAAKSTLKNILFLRSLRKHKWGGVEKWMFEVGKGLREKGYNVIYGARPGSRFNDYAKEHSFIYYDIKFSSDINPIISNNLRKIIKNENIDLICAGEEKELRLLAPVCWFGKRPAIVIRKGLSLIKDRWRFKIIYDMMVDRIITPSNALADELLDLLPWLDKEKISVIHNGISIPDNVNKGIFRSDINIENNTFLISVIGRFSKQKGHEYLIEALKNIKDKLEDTIVVFVGDGEEKSRNVEKVRKYDLGAIVKFVGHRWDIGNILTDTDLLIHPSLYEGMPNTILEAMSYSTPVLATNIPGVDEIDMGEKVIELVEPENSEALADKILMLKSNPEYRIELGRKGRTHVSKHFSLERMLTVVEKTLLKTVNNSKK